MSTTIVLPCSAAAPSCEMLFGCTETQPVKAAEVKTETMQAVKRQFIEFSLSLVCGCLWSVLGRVIGTLDTSYQC
ncbi:protein of unknown function [Burkholderia multivorans]